MLLKFWMHLVSVSRESWISWYSWVSAMISFKSSWALVKTFGSNLNIVPILTKISVWCWLNSGRRSFIQSLILSPVYWVLEFWIDCNISRDKFFCLWYSQHVDFNSRKQSLIILIYKYQRNKFRVGVRKLRSVTSPDKWQRDRLKILGTAWMTCEATSLQR